MKIADNNPKVFVSEILGGLLFSSVGTLISDNLIGSAVGTVGLLLFLVGVGNFIYFLYLKFFKKKVLK